jgi:antitoxin component HigA of HigAB toxin-antitoxin module
MSDSGNLVPRSYRLPQSVVTYLDSLKNRSDFVIKALESAIAEHRLMNENSVIGRAKAIMQVEDEIADIQQDETYRDALKGLSVLSIPDPERIHWLGEVRETRRGMERIVTSKEHAVFGNYQPDPFKEGVTFAPEAFDRYTTMGKDYYTRIVSDYKTRISQLVEKREKLKAEILKSSQA